MEMDFLRRRLGLVSGGGTSSLAQQRQRLQRAEAELEAARAAMRSAADAAGVERSGLFSDTAFVPRSTADKWHADGRREGEKTMINILSRSIDADSADENSRFRHLARRLKKIQPADWPEHVAQMRAFIASDEVYPVVQSKGAAIVAAGKRARMSADQAGEVPEPTGFAAKVILAGKRRRGEV